MYLRNILSIAGVFSVLSASAMNLDEILVGSESDSQKVEILTRVLTLKEGENAKLRTDLSQKTLAVAQLLETGNQLVVELGTTIAQAVSMCGLFGESLRNMQRMYVGDMHLLDLAWSLEQVRPDNWIQLKRQLENPANKFCILPGVLPEQLQAPAAAAVPAQQQAQAAPQHPAQ